jgi:hypothetical protein
MADRETDSKSYMPWQSNSGTGSLLDSWCNDFLFS